MGATMRAMRGAAQQRSEESAPRTPIMTAAPSAYDRAVGGSSTIQPMWPASSAYTVYS